MGYSSRGYVQEVSSQPHALLSALREVSSPFICSLYADVCLNNTSVEEKQLKDG